MDDHKVDQCMCVVDADNVLLKIAGTAADVAGKLVTFWPSWSDALVVVSGCNSLDTLDVDHEVDWDIYGDNTNNIRLILTGTVADVSGELETLLAGKVGALEVREIGKPVI